MSRYSKKPVSRFEKLQNCSLALQFIKSEGVQLLGIGPEGSLTDTFLGFHSSNDQRFLIVILICYVDIVDPNTKLILGLVWMLILHYHLQSGPARVPMGSNEPPPIQLV